MSELKTTDRQNPSIFLLSPTFRQYSQRIVYHLAAQVHFPKETTGICMT